MSEQPKTPTSEQLLAQQNANTRSQNIKRTFGEGKGRATLILICGGIVLFAGIGLWKMSSSTKAAQAADPTEIGATNATTNTGNTVESEDEKKARLAANASAAAQAAAEGKPYFAPQIMVASDPQAEQVAGQVIFDASKAASSPAAVPMNNMTPEQARAYVDSYNAQRTANANQAELNQRLADIKQNQNVDKNGNFGQLYIIRDESGNEMVLNEAQYQSYVDSMAKLKDSVQKNSVYPQLDAIKTLSKGQRLTGYTSLSFSLPNREVAKAPGESAAGGKDQAAKKGKRLVMAGEAFYAQLANGVDTGDGGIDIVSKVVMGRLNGANLIGTVAQGQNNISFTFQSMSIPHGNQFNAKPGSYKVKAMAVTEDTANRSMADNVDRHWFEKYGSLMLAGLLEGFGAAAIINSQTGTTISTPTGNGTQVITNTQPLSNGDIAMIALGNMGKTVAGELKQNAGTIKTTYSSNARKPIVIVFLEDVYEGDLGGNNQQAVVVQPYGSGATGQIQQPAQYNPSYLEQLKRYRELNGVNNQYPTYR